MRSKVTSRQTSVNWFVFQSTQTGFVFIRIVLTTLISFARQFFRKKKKPMIIYAFNNDAWKSNPLIALVLFSSPVILRTLVANIFFMKVASLWLFFSQRELCKIIWLPLISDLFIFFIFYFVLSYEFIFIFIILWETLGSILAEVIFFAIKFFIF